MRSAFEGIRSEAHLHATGEILSAGAWGSTACGAGDKGACENLPLKKIRPVRNRSFFYAKKEYLLRGTLRDSTCSVRMRVAYLLPFIVAVFVAASHVMSVTPRAVARSLIGRNVLPSLICTVADAGIVLPLTVTTFWPATIVMIL